MGSIPACTKLSSALLSNVPGCQTRLSQTVPCSAMPSWVENSCAVLSCASPGCAELSHAELGPC